MKKDELRKEWEHQIALFRSSGLTQAKWCAINEIKLHQLKYWLKRLEGSTSTPSPSASWTPIVIEESTPLQEDTLQIKIGDASIEVKSGFNPSLFAEVVRTLKTLC
jgi:hypothetical protein